MARQLSVGDQVYVPCARLGLTDRPFALYETVVVARDERSVVVKMPNGASSTRIGASLVHRQVGLVIVRVGDFLTETTLLDPLTKSILQYCRLLVQDSDVTLVEVRALDELAHWWSLNEAAYSHLILIGHGRENGVRFAVGDWIGADALVNALLCGSGRTKIVLSLCCETGRAAFGKSISINTWCEAFVAPFQAVHGAVASQFCQTFLAHQLLEGRTTTVAWRYARGAVPGSASFRLWQDGGMKLARFNSV